MSKIRYLLIVVQILIKKSIRLFGLFHFKIMLAKAFLRVRPVCPTYCMLLSFVFPVKTHIRYIDFQYNSELFTFVNFLSFIDKVTVDQM